MVAEKGKVREWGASLTDFILQDMEVHILQNADTQMDLRGQV